MSDCQLEVAPFFQCCCTCVFRLASGNKTKEKFFEPDGNYVCAPPDSGMANLNWREHSCGCEMHTKIKDDSSQIPRTIPIKDES